MNDDTSKKQSNGPATEDWGRLHVTHKCSGAATCRNFAPELLGEVAPPPTSGGETPHSKAPPVLPGSHEPGAPTGVLRQPRDLQEFLQARVAAAACPFGAIKLNRPSAGLPSGALGSPWHDWPRRLEDNVWVLGHPAPRNYGALAYFIELPGGGVLVDLPKPSEEMFHWLEQHGGVRWLFLTHRDHMQHHDEFAARFPGCRRVMAAADAGASDMEVKLGSGRGPVLLDGTPLAQEALADTELAVIPQPGHTRGTQCLLYRGHFFFTGDHLWYSRSLGHIAAHRPQCWWNWEEQCASVLRLVEWARAGWFRFTWILPGHGDWHRFEDAAGPAMSVSLERGLEWMER